MAYGFQCGVLADLAAFSAASRGMSWPVASTQWIFAYLPAHHLHRATCLSAAPCIVFLRPTQRSICPAPEASCPWGGYQPQFFR